MKQFTIQDLEQFSGIKKHTIRVWEQRYGFLTPKRINGYTRRYSPQEINVLLDAALLNQNGIKVSRIASMDDEEMKKNISSSEYRKDKTIHDLIIAMAERDSERFDSILDRCVLHGGIHNTIVEVIYPFAERIGLLDKWENKSYLENIFLIKESLKRKLYFGIENTAPDNQKNKNVFLFLLQGEKQELPLLFLNYFLKAEGYIVTHLGTGISLEYLINMIEHKLPDYCITTEYETTKRYDTNNSFKSLPLKYPAIHFISMGNIKKLYKGSTTYKHLYSIDQIINTISQV